MGKEMIEGLLFLLAGSKAAGVGREEMAPPTLPTDDERRDVPQARKEKDPFNPYPIKKSYPMPREGTICARDEAM